MPSVTVEFDHFQNAPANPPADFNGNHVAIAINGITSFPAVDPGFVLESFAGPRRFAWVDYDGVTLDVFLSETAAKPALPLISRVVDIQGIVGDQAFIGFTASRAAAISEHRLFDFFIDLSFVGGPSAAERASRHPSAPQRSSSRRTGRSH